MTERRTTEPTMASRTTKHRGSGHVRGATLQLRVDELTTCDALEGLRSDWHQLVDRCPWATPFQSPDWLLPWWRAIGRGDLCVTTLRRSGRLVGLAPLFIYGGPDGRRRLTMLGAGVSDYEDVLLEPELAYAGAALRLAGAARFEVLVSGRAPFALWDGVAFHLARA